MMAEVFKLLLPFYERQRDFFHMMEMYGKLHEAFKSVVNIMTTGKRYLGTYFRVAFFGLVSCQSLSVFVDKCVIIILTRFCCLFVCLFVCFCGLLIII